MPRRADGPFVNPTLSFRRKRHSSIDPHQSAAASLARQIA
jgi:hypothetical protein